MLVVVYLFVVRCLLRFARRSCVFLLFVSGLLSVVCVVCVVFVVCCCMMFVVCCLPFVVCWLFVAR